MSYFIIKVITDYHVIVALIFVIISIKWGDWKSWERYYPTMLFFTTGNLVYIVLTYNYPLWEYESPILKCTVSNLLEGLVTYSLATMLYLSHMPKGILKKVLWIIFWIFLYSGIEIISCRLGFISHHNSWTIWWSVFFNCLMFPLLWLHYKKPIWALLSSVVIAGFFIIYFKIPFASMK